MRRLMDKLLWTAMLCTGGIVSGTSSMCDAAEPVDADQKAAEQAVVDSEVVDSESAEFFVREVRPLLEQNCYKCHGNGESRGNLNLESRAAILKGGDLGPAVSLETPNESTLLQAVNYDGLEMPPDGKLSDAEIAVLTKWVKLGLPWSGDEKNVHAEASGSLEITDFDREFWAYQRVERPAVPDVQNREWVKTPIDAFILSALEQQNLQPMGRADKVALIRRATYDLTGLPPTPAQVQEFVADDSPDAFERLVDRLLDSPHYGERWARHWLDLVRYAETNSFERDGAKPFVWRYRDYVIRAFNADKPYDQFVREQLAGDELDQVTPDSIIATGYYRLGQWDDEPADPELAMYDDLDDIITTTSQVLLGTTMNCARCHDHKIDPIPQTDYYRFLAFFRNIQRYGVRSAESVEKASVRRIATADEQRRHAEELKRHAARIAEIDAAMQAIVDRVRDDFSNVERDEFVHEPGRIPILKKRVPEKLDQATFDRYVALHREQKRLRENPPQAGIQALCVKEHGASPPETHVLVRGNPQAQGEVVEPGFPEVLSFPEPEIPPPDPDGNSSGRRRVLAEWMTSPENPLFARVMVNRIWQYHFGRGLVSTPNDFGYQGASPTHPKLLDWLASEFVIRGWKIKEMHRLIMLSNVYALSSKPSPKLLEADPENELLGRFNMRRLEAEEIRDSILFVNGSLNLETMFGPSMYPKIPDAVLAGQSRPGQGWGDSPESERDRRSIYIHIKRSLLTPILKSFDTADPDQTCPVRFATVQPTQALGMLNSAFINEQAREFARFVLEQDATDLNEQVTLILSRVLQREPTAQEIERGRALLERMRTTHGLDPEDALQNFCIVALNLNEFFYLD